MSLVNFMLTILGLQFIWFGILYMYESRERKKGSKGSFLRNWWRTTLAMILLIIDFGLVGFARGIEPYLGG